MKYSNAQITLHWLTVLLVLILMVSGMAYSLEWTESDVIDMHQIVGQSLIVVLAARIALRLARPLGPDPNERAAWESWLSKSIHLGFYVILLAYVATGYVAASALSDPALIAPLSKAFARSDLGETLLYVHYGLKWLLLGAIALHVAGALKHALFDHDQTLRTMWFQSPKG